MYTLKVREVAEAKGVNRSQLSRRTDISMSTLNDLWDGTRTNVKMTTLAAIARALGVSISDLYEEVYNPEDIRTPGHAAPALEPA
jgi:DNA-binding Xre family transcriptional regulator